MKKYSLLQRSSQLQLLRGVWEKKKSRPCSPQTNTRRRQLHYEAREKSAHAVSSALRRRVFQALHSGGKNHPPMFRHIYMQALFHSSSTVLLMSIFEPVFSARFRQGSRELI